MTNIISVFTFPVMKVQLDLDVEKLTEFAVQMQEQNNIGIQKSNVRGWQSSCVYKETHEEFSKLKREIDQYLQIYHSEAFQNPVFKVTVVSRINNIWVNINEKSHSNAWHNHPMSTLSGTYYIKHDGTKENGDITFRYPPETKEWYGGESPGPQDLIKVPNQVTSGITSISPSTNSLIIFPSWLEHKVEDNSKDDIRISVSFNSCIMVPDAYLHVDQFEHDIEKNK